MSIAANVEEIIRLDNLLGAIRKQRVVSIADLNEYRWLREQRRYQVRAIQNYRPETTSIR